MLDIATQEEPEAIDNPIEENLEAAPAESSVAKLRRWADETITDNIAGEIDAGRLVEIGMNAVDEYKIDLESRSNWETDAKNALKLALQRADQKSSPWPNASNVILPIMSEAADQFAARAYPAIVADRNVVKGMIYGSDEGIPATGPDGTPLVDPMSGQPQWQVPPGAKQKRADRIGEHMSWQLLEEQPEWEEDTDKMMHVLPIVGCAFRKSYFDSNLRRNSSVFVSALDVVVNYWAKSLATAPRISEILKLYPHEIEEMKRSGHFLETFEVGQAADGGMDKDHPHTFIEQHRRLDLDDDGYAEPYIVTVHLETFRVARIAPRYDLEGIIVAQDSMLHGPRVIRINPIDYYTKYDFIPNKEGGIYGQGFGQLLRPINEASNTVLNQIIDAATLANNGGGFIGKGLSLHTGVLRRTMGEWTVVNAAGGDIRNAVVPLQHKEPSSVLFQVLGFLHEQAKSVSSIKDVMSGDIKAQTMSPTVFMALVEQGLKMFTSIWKRIHRSLKSELDKLYRLNRIYLEEQRTYRVGDQWKEVSREDYATGSGVEPVSDKNMVADVQKLARAEFLSNLKDDARLDGKEILRRMFEAAGIPDIDKIIKQQEDTNPELLMRIGELELRQMSAKATAIKDMALGIKAMAEADATVMEPFHEWMMAQFQAMQERMNVLTQSSTPTNQGTNAGGAGSLETQPGNAGLPSLLGGRPGSPGAAAPGAMGRTAGAA